MEPHVQITKAGLLSLEVGGLQQVLLQDPGDP